VPDLAAARPAEELRLTRRERREVVVEVEALVLVVEDLVHALHVAAGAQGDLREDLRLAAGEDRRAVHAREVVDLAPDVADLVRLATVDPEAFREDHVPHDLALDGGEGGLDVALAAHRLLERVEAGLLGGDVGLGLVRLVLLGGRDLGLGGLAEDLLHDRLADLGEAPVEVLLVVGLAEVLLDPSRRDLADAVDEARVRNDGLVLERLDLAAIGFEGREEVVLSAAERLDGLVREVQRVDHVVLRDLQHLALDHHDGVLLTCDDEVEVGLCAVVARGVDDPLAVDAADAHVRRGPVERSSGEDQRCGRAHAGHDVGVDLAGLRRSRCRGPGPRCGSRPGRAGAWCGRRGATRAPPCRSGGPFALHEAAGEHAAGAELLAVVHGQREEALALADVLVEDDGAEHHRVALSGDDRRRRPAWRAVPSRG
jgi:hypothetical protein